MIFEMNLNASPYEKIASGSKTVGLRLFDAKRRRSEIGDKIVFTNLDEPMKKIAVIVKSLHRYASFVDLFADIPIEKCGNSSTDTPDMAAAGMSKYYTADQIRKYGVLGIEIVITDTPKVLKQLEEQKEAEFDRLFPDGMK